MAIWFAIGMGSKNSKGEWLEVYYPKNLINPSESIVSKAKELIGYKNANFTGPVPQELLAEVNSLSTNFSKLEEEKSVLVIVDSEEPPNNVPSSYLRLHLLSHRLVKPNKINLEGIFGLLPTVAWTSDGPKDPNELDDILSKKRVNNESLHIHSLDKFPCMTDYVIPEGVRIADSHRVRLGAYLGEGTTVMHEGFINFNAGTLGKSMVEGRISQGVVVG